MLSDALLHLVQGIVSSPDSVRVLSSSRGCVVQVDEADYGCVIGRGGRTANALRTVAGVLSSKPVRVEITTRRYRQ